MTKRFLIAALLAAAALPATALTTDNEQPIEVHADQFNGDEVKQTAVYSGSVTVDQGSINIRGARLELRITPKGYRQATVTGTPARFKQKRDPDPKQPSVEEWMHAEANRIVYDEETDTITLTGAAKLSRTENGAEKDVTRGERIVYNMRYARSSVDGGIVGGQRQRVTTIIAPRSSKTAEAQREGASLSSADKLTNPKKD